jgi:peptidoglycan hydrolase-like protein with peptidoglycan-binding domain
MAGSLPTLKKGSRGDAVKGLQNALNARSSQGVGAVDGIFGPATENAVKQFQRDVGLVEDGIAGPATWEELYVCVVQRGDTLSKIAEQNLGDADRWPDIYDLNRALISDPDKIPPDEILTLPIYGE